MPKVDMPRPPDPQLDPAGYLKCLPAVRERSRIVFDKAMRNELNHFDVDMSKMKDVVSFVSGLIKVRCTPLVQNGGNPRTVQMCHPCAVVAARVGMDALPATKLI